MRAFVERITAALFPAWLESARDLGELAGVGEAALRTLARQEARRSDLFGPFLEAFCVSSMEGSEAPCASGFDPQTVIVECAKLIRRSYSPPRRPALVLALGDGALGDTGELALTFIAELDAFPIRLLGAGVHQLRRIPVQRTSFSPIATREHLRPYMTALSGQPNPLSETEVRMEAYLGQHRWAQGRRWNHTMTAHAMDRPIRVDLVWEQEGCIVEFDGPEHASLIRYQDDRWRDRVLQRAGFAVLRFTNDEVKQDLTRVADEIAAYVSNRRR